GLSLNDVGCPAGGNGTPGGFLEEKGLGEHRAPDDGVDGFGFAPITADPGVQLLERADAILDSEGIPGKGRRERCVADKEAAAYDEILGAVGLKAEAFSRFEPAAKGLPAIHSSLVLALRHLMWAFYRGRENNH